MGGLLLNMQNILVLYDILFETFFENFRGYENFSIFFFFFLEGGTIFLDFLNNLHTPCPHKKWKKE